MTSKLNTLKVVRSMEREDSHLGFTSKEKSMKRHGKKLGSWNVYNKALNSARSRASTRAIGRRQDIERSRD